MDSTATSCVVLDFDMFECQDEDEDVCSPESSVVVLDFESHNRSTVSVMLVFDFDSSSPMKPPRASTPLIQKKAATSRVTTTNAIRQLSFTELSSVQLCNVQESFHAMTNYSWPGNPQGKTSYTQIIYRICVVMPERRQGYA